MARLDGKGIYITGAANGNGNGGATAHLFAAEGAPLGAADPEHVAPLALDLAADESRQVSAAILPLYAAASAL